MMAVPLGNGAACLGEKDSWANEAEVARAQASSSAADRGWGDIGNSFMGKGFETRGARTSGTGVASPPACRCRGDLFCASLQSNGSCHARACAGHSRHDGETVELDFARNREIWTHRLR